MISVRGKEIKVTVKVQGGREVKKYSEKHYLPPHKSFSQFFEDLKVELNAIINEILRR